MVTRAHRLYISIEFIFELRIFSYVTIKCWELDSLEFESIFGWFVWRISRVVSHIQISYAWWFCDVEFITNHLYISILICIFLWFWNTDNYISVMGFLQVIQRSLSSLSRISIIWVEADSFSSSELMVLFNRANILWWTVLFTKSSCILSIYFFMPETCFHRFFLLASYEDIFECINSNWAITRKYLKIALLAKFEYISPSHATNLQQESQYMLAPQDTFTSISSSIQF